MMRRLAWQECTQDWHPGEAIGMIALLKTPLIPFLLSLLIGSVPLILNIAPAPAVHDEFAYILAADTFAHGRLTNPPLPAEIAPSFETMHVLVRPTYASKFPPGQGIALWIGWLIGGQMMLGAVLSVAAGCAAIAWALRAIVPERWAIAGGLIAATHPLLFDWQTSYWGGGVSLLGGAITIGAAARIARTLRSRRAGRLRVPRFGGLPASRATGGVPQDRRHILHGAALAVGLGILANSRPFEGLLLAAVLFCWILLCVVKLAHWRTFIRAGWAFVAIMLIVAAWDGYYNWRITGSPLRMPYAEHASQYMAAPLFWWQRLPPAKHYASEVLRDFHENFERTEYAKQTTPMGYLKTLPIKIWSMIKAWLAPGALLLLLPGAAWALRRRPAARWAAAAIVLVPALEMALSPWFRVHYSAVVGGAIFLLIGAALYEIVLRSRAIGVAVLAIILAANLISVGLHVRQMIVAPWFAGIPRQRLVDQLEALPGKHLVFIRYVPGRENLTEWVYNGADLPASKIIFARSLDAAADRRVIAHFGGRTVWGASVDVDYTLVRLSDRNELRR